MNQNLNPQKAPTSRPDGGHKVYSVTFFKKPDLFIMEPYLFPSKMFKIQLSSSPLSYSNPKLSHHGNDLRDSAKIWPGTYFTKFSWFECYASLVALIMIVVIKLILVFFQSYHLDLHFELMYPFSKLSQNGLHLRGISCAQTRKNSLLNQYANSGSGTNGTINQTYILHTHQVTSAGLILLNRFLSHISNSGDCPVACPLYCASAHCQWCTYLSRLKTLSEVRVSGQLPSFSAWLYIHVVTTCMMNNDTVNSDSGHSWNDLLSIVMTDAIFRESSPSLTKTATTEMLGIGEMSRQ